MRVLIVPCMNISNGCCFGYRSGKDFDITSQRVAASNPLLKEAFVEVL